MKIKNCAECGSTATLKEFAHSKKAVACDSCDHRGESFVWGDQAIVRWNYRQKNRAAFYKMCLTLYPQSV
jgi:hypothetical protein